MVELLDGFGELLNLFLIIAFFEVELISELLFLNSKLLDLSVCIINHSCLFLGLLLNFIHLFFQLIELAQQISLIFLGFFFLVLLELTEHLLVLHQRLCLVQLTCQFYNFLFQIFAVILQPLVLFFVASYPHSQLLYLFVPTAYLVLCPPKRLF